MTPRHWLGVASKNHVMIGVEHGFAQVCHGKRGPLLRLNPGDGIVYYSPALAMGDKGALQAFTAIGWILPGEPVQVQHSHDFSPWRRPVNYFLDVRDAPLADLRSELELTRPKNWGYALRRGLLPLSANDFTTIEHSMRNSAVAAL
jgi:hypothetical protein